MVLRVWLLLLLLLLVVVVVVVMSLLLFAVVVLTVIHLHRLFRGRKTGFDNSGGVEANTNSGKGTAEQSTAEISGFDAGTKTEVCFLRQAHIRRQISACLFFSRGQG